MTRPTFVLRVRPEPGVEPIRALRAWLKNGLRAHGLRAISIEEKTTTDQPEPQTKMETLMPVDFNKVKEDEPFPAGIYHLRATLLAGAAGSEGLLKQSQNSIIQLLVLEYKVVKGPHAGRKIKDWISCELDEDQRGIAPEKLADLNTAVRLGNLKLKAILNSAHGLRADDESESAQKIRRPDSYTAFNGLVFQADVKIQPARAPYPARNAIDFVVLPGDDGYEKYASNGAGIAVVKEPKPKLLGDDMDDSIPF
jgi:hypothetical protein